MILLDDVYRQGLESRIEECQSADESAINCNHAEDAGVACRVNEGKLEPRKALRVDPSRMTPLFYCLPYGCTYTSTSRTHIIRTAQTAAIKCSSGLFYAHVSCMCIVLWHGRFFALPKN